MDSNILIAVVGITGTLTGAVVSVIITYFVQKRLSERQRKWAHEDEERRKEYEQEAEQKRIKKELLSKRLDVFEESIKMMMNRLSSAMGRELGIPMYDDSDQLQEQGMRLQSIRGEAYASLVALDSQDLMEHWKAIASAYTEVTEVDAIAYESFDKAQKAYVQIIKLTDEMRSKV